MKDIVIYNGDCLIELKNIQDNTVDAIVTDPPYGLGFMGKKWDCSVPSLEVWKECLRVLKPGGHLLSFGGTRTYHRMASAIEDAGFEVRDMIEWVYSTGFPKSLNVYKQLQRMGSERAEEFAGVGTATKPAHEPICMARKPLSEKTVAENVLKWGTSGINIGESRFGTEKITVKGGNKNENGFTFCANYKEVNQEHTGRFPTNLIIEGSEEVKWCFPNESYRFFNSIIYQAKASKSERNKGCEDLEGREVLRQGLVGENNNPTHKNNHPTIKPIALMEYLVKMVTPKDGVVLDPFMGSGTTGVACKKLKIKFIGIELDKEYFEIAKKRIENY